MPGRHAPSHARGMIDLVVLPGDGIGPEIVRATSDVLEAAADICSFQLSLRTADIGFKALEASGTWYQRAANNLKSVERGE